VHSQWLGTVKLPYLALARTANLPFHSYASSAITGGQCGPLAPRVHDMASLGTNGQTMQDSELQQLQSSKAVPASDEVAPLHAK
jgi:hypothetical protein